MDKQRETEPLTFRRAWCWLFHWTKQERVGKYIWICGHCREIFYGK